MRRTATIRTETLYRVIGNTDLEEGRGKSYTVGWFVNRVDAKRSAKGEGVFGGDWPIDQEQKDVVVLPNGKMFLLDAEVTVKYVDPEKAKKAALSKLSAADKRALGLKE